MRTTGKSIPQPRREIGLGSEICRMSGRYPWDIEDMHMMYGEYLQFTVLKPYVYLTYSSGDVVRIGPNELTFATVQSFNGAYES